MPKAKQQQQQKQSIRDHKSDPITNVVVANVDHGRETHEDAHHHRLTTEGRGEVHHHLPVSKSDEDPELQKRDEHVDRGHVTIINREKGLALVSMVVTSIAIIAFKMTNIVDNDLVLGKSVDIGIENIFDSLLLAS